MGSTICKASHKRNLSRTLVLPPFLSSQEKQTEREEGEKNGDLKVFLGIGPGRGGVLPSELDAVGSPGLGAPSLLDVAGGRHHLLHGPVVVQMELMDHVLSVLDNSHLGMTGMSPKMPAKRCPVHEELCQPREAPATIKIPSLMEFSSSLPSTGWFIIPNFMALPPAPLPSFGVIQMCPSLDPQRLQVGPNWLIWENLGYSCPNPCPNSCLNPPTITQSERMESSSQLP